MTNAMKKIVVVGDGGWGTALALSALAAGRDAALWSYDAKYAEVMRTSRTNPRYLPGFPLPDRLTIHHEMAEAAQGADLLVSAVPTAFLRATWSALAPHVPEGTPVVSVSKGLERDTLLRPTQILAEVLSRSEGSVAVLSGPNIAGEIAAGLPAATVVASADADLSARIQKAFSGASFRVYSNPDPVGVELGGVLKNVVALAAGICDGLKLGVNAKAALVSRGLLEMARLGVALGGRRETFFGLAGLGDLMTTCYSASSRNRTFGERLGRGERVEDISASMQQVAEGVKSVGPLSELMHRHGLSGPVTEEARAVVHDGKAPADAVHALMTRASRDEGEDLAPADSA